jgi:hypothetical protein
MEENAAGMDNLEPGTAAPRDGTYVCCWCGPGGLAQTMAGPMLALRSGGTMSNSDYAMPASTRLTVYTMAAGDRLPECPTCGKATGWELLTGTLDELLHRRVAMREKVFATLGVTRAEPADPDETDPDRLSIITDETRGGAPCDCCGRRLPPSAGYLLPMSLVLVSEAYWCHFFRLFASSLDDLPDDATREVFLSQRLRSMTRDRTPWLVCDGCTEMFVADWTAAREHVVRGTRPRGPGRLRDRFQIADAALPAARAWTRERGSWPSTVVSPAVAADDECDLCGKPVWPKETVSFVKPDVVERWRGSGALTTASDTPPRTTFGEPGWLVCMPCLAAAVAREYRSIGA